MSLARNLANLKPSTAGLIGSEDVDTSLVQKFSFRNRIINGDMRIAKMSNGSSVSVSSGYQYGVDRSRGFVGGSGRFTSQISTDAPDGFSNSLSMTVTTAQTSFGASELLVPFEQSIEGNNFSDLAFGSASANPISISFYVKASIAGKYSVSVFNNTGTVIDTSYVSSVVINSANTWEYKSLTIPGATIGSWQKGSGVGIYLSIGSYGGSNFIGTENSWQSDFNEFSSGCVNMFGTVGAYLRVTGVQLEPGNVSTPFERIPYTQQIELCERYFRTNREVSGGSSVGGGTAAFRVDFSGMRAQPTITLRNTVDVFEGMYYGRYSANAITGFWVPKAIDIGIEISSTVSFPSQVPIHMFGDTLNLSAEI